MFNVRVSNGFNPLNNVPLNATLSRRAVVGAGLGALAVGTAGCGGQNFPITGVPPLVPAVARIASSGLLTGVNNFPGTALSTHIVSPRNGEQPLNTVLTRTGNQSFSLEDTANVLVKIKNQSIIGTSNGLKVLNEKTGRVTSLGESGIQINHIEIMGNKLIASGTYLNANGTGELGVVQIFDADTLVLIQKIEDVGFNPTSFTLDSNGNLIILDAGTFYLPEPALYIFNSEGEKIASHLLPFNFVGQLGGRLAVIGDYAYIGQTSLENDVDGQLVKVNLQSGQTEIQENSMISGSASSVTVFQALETAILVTALQTTGTEGALFFINPKNGKTKQIYSVTGTLGPATVTATENGAITYVSVNAIPGENAPSVLEVTAETQQG